MKKIELKEIPIEKVKGNPLQPREYFDREKIKELAETIKKIGLINPITVRKAKNGSYQVVTGERRLKASEIAKLRTIPALIKEYKAEDEIAIESLIENVHRENLNPIEQAKFIKRIWEILGKPLSKQGNPDFLRLEEKLNLDEKAIREAFGLLRMSIEVKEAVQKGKLAMRSASLISQLPEKKQVEIAKEAIRRDEGERIGRTEISRIIEEERPEPPQFERTANDVANDILDDFSNITRNINELVKEMNIRDLSKSKADRLITSEGVLIFKTFRKLNQVLAKRGAKFDKKILDLMRK